MQLLVRAERTLAVEASPGDSVAQLKAAVAARLWGSSAAACGEQLVLIAGRSQLADGDCLAAAGLVHGSTLSVASRLRGAGGDGGSTGAESRSCYLEMYAERKPDKVNPAEAMLARATRCRLSGERLAPPCVGDELGSLFNKEALVHALLNKTMPPGLAHIGSLKAVINLQLDPIPRPTAAGAAAGAGSAGPGPGSKAAAAAAAAAASADTPHFQCPLTGLEMNGRYPFVIHRPSGRVLSERALRDVPLAVEELLGCKWSQDDLIPVNPTGEELEQRMEALAAALAAERARKRAKKAHKAGDKAAAGGDAPGAGAKRALPPAGPAPLAPGAGSCGQAAVAAAANGGAAAAKKLKLPPGATPEVYSSIFAKPGAGAKETFLCRSVTGRGLGGV